MGWKSDSEAQLLPQRGLVQRPGQISEPDPAIDYRTGHVEAGQLNALVGLRQERTHHRHQARIVGPVIRGLSEWSAGTGTH